jgi:hypothetical protein
MGWQPPYYDKKGRKVKYDKEGNPDFSPYATHRLKSDSYDGKRDHNNRIANNN